MTRTIFAVCAAALAALLAGCHRSPPRAPLESDAAAAGRHATSTAAAAVPQPAASAASASASASAHAPTDREPDVAAGTGNPAAIMGAAAGPASDGTITGQVRRAFAGDKELRPLAIDVDTQNGVVTLSGLAPTASAKAHADEVAHRVKGVVAVNNQLTLPSG